MYYVYVLKSINFRKSHVGFTNNIERRLLEHNSGKNIFTRRYKPWKLIYKEDFNRLEDAIHKEKYYKSHSGRNKLKEIFNNCQIV